MPRIMPPMDGAMLEFLENVAMGLSATVALLALVGLSIPSKVRVSRPHSSPADRHQR